MEQPVSRELFTLEVKNIKQSVSDVKSDIKELKNTIEELTTSINDIKLTHVENSSRIKQLEGTIIKAGESMEKITVVLEKVNIRVIDLDKRVTSIEKYPSYMKWTLGVILSSLLLWKAIKEHLL